MQFDRLTSSVANRWLCRSSSSFTFYVYGLRLLSQAVFQYGLSANCWTCSLFSSVQASSYHPRRIASATSTSIASHWSFSFNSLISWHTIVWAHLQMSKTSYVLLKTSTTPSLPRGFRISLLHLLSIHIAIVLSSSSLIFFHLMMSSTLIV